jgi:3-methyladenine DNA glycosylase/8-oxoguanine DNA glycosylase
VADVLRSWRPGVPVSLQLVLAPHRRGRGDPTFATDADGGLWRSAWTPDGPGTIRLSRRGDEVEVRCWGAGAEWLAEAAPAWVGQHDDLEGFEPDVPVLRDGSRRTAGPRIGHTGLVWEALVPAVLEQKVTGRQARASWRTLVRRYGEPAPGPTPGPLLVTPPPAVWRQIPSWDYHQAGVGPQRRDTLLRAAAIAARLEAAVDLPREQADRRLRCVPGVGAWTSAEVRQRALGDPDAVSVGDAHVPRLVVFALTGRVSDSDDDMLAVLEPYRGHRFRVQRLLELTTSAPRFGPRFAGTDVRAF